MSMNLRIRRLVPSISRITYHPLMKRLLDLFDILPRLVFREFRRLPPNHLRCRVGVSNRLFANQVLHLTRGTGAWLYWFTQGWCSLTSNIVELGVGCGRRAFHMRDFNHHGERFSGTYLGIDIDAEALAWCRDNFDARFEFVQSTHESKSYINDSANERSGFRIPRDDASVDFVFGTSVFSHLLEDQARNYLDEGARVLRPGGRMVVTCFCLDLQPGKVGDRHSFRHRLGTTYVESLAQPEAAVAYESDVIKQMAIDAGFEDAWFLHTQGDVQQSLVCTR